MSERRTRGNGEDHARRAPAERTERAKPTREPAEKGAQRTGRTRGFDVTLHSEFGHVRVSEDRSANGPRLRVEALRTGQVIYLDPLELESLAHWRHQDLQMIVLTAAYTAYEPDDPDDFDGGPPDADP